MASANYYIKDKEKGVFVLFFSYNDFVNLPFATKNSIHKNFTFDREKKAWVGKKKMDASRQAYIAQEMKLRFEGGKEEIVSRPPEEDIPKAELVYVDPPEEGPVIGKVLERMPSEVCVAAFLAEGKRKARGIEQDYRYDE